MPNESILKSKLGTNTEKWKLDYIKGNAQLYTVRQLHEAVELSEVFIHAYFQQNNIPYKKITVRKSHKHSPVVPIRPRIERREEWERPPAVYSNKSREQYIDEILKLPCP